LNGDASTSRLNKRMAELGLCSRREADAWIGRGWVRVDGQVALMGMQVAPTARIEIDRRAQGQQQQQVTICCTSDRLRERAGRKDGAISQTCPIRDG